MRISIRDYNTNEDNVLDYGGNDLQPVIPEKDETILVNQKWYKVFNRLISYRKVPCEGGKYHCMDLNVYLWVEKLPIPDQELGIIPDPDEYNRVVTKTKFQAYEECMELLQPGVIPHRQTKENREFDGWNYLLKRNEELVRENTRLKDYLRQVYLLMQNIKENDGVSLDLMTKIASVVGTIKETLNFDEK